MDKQISLKAIKEEFSVIKPEGIPQAIAAYMGDERKGVQTFLNSMQKKYEKYLAEIARIEAMSEFEKRHAGLNYVCGIDEVGRGPLAGPVVTAAVVLKKDCRILYINDSKKLSAAKRDELYEEICDKAVAIGIGMENHEVIDEINILQATYSAMRKAVGALKTKSGEVVKPDLLLVDAVHIPDVDIKQVSIVKGDEKSISIAAASIIAKVTRDRMMEEFDRIYPGYGFASNKGYGSSVHINAIKELGPCPIHRQSFIGKILNDDIG